MAHGNIIVNQEKGETRMKDKKNQTVTAAVKPKKKKTVLIVVLIIVVLLIAVIGSAVKNMSKQVEAVSNAVEVEAVQKRDLSDTISLKGTISGISSTNVTSKAASEITAVNVQVGDIVKEGDVLCTLDTKSIEENISELEKNVSNTNAVNSINSKTNAKSVEEAKQDQQTQLDDAMTAIIQAQEDYDGADHMYESGQGDFASVQAAQRALESAQENYDKVLETTNRAIESAQTQVELGKYQNSDNTTTDTLKNLKEQLADCTITAPNGGVVTAVNVRVGDINSDKVTLLTIEDTSALKIVATVGESDILKIEEGMKATVTSDATGEEEISGTVSRVVRVKSSGSTSSDGSSSSAGGYSVEITIDSTELLIGMDAKARIMIQEKGEVLAVPYDLVKTDDDGNSYVLVAQMNDDGSANVVRKNIEVGETVDYYTEVTGGDLQEGDNMIYDYAGTVTEGQVLAAAQMYSGNMDEAGTTEAGTNAEGME